MLNSTNHNMLVNKINVDIKPACSGLLQRSCPESKFLRFHKNSDMANYIFSRKPHLNTDSYCCACDFISILQIMVFGDNEFLIEYIDI